MIEKERELEAVRYASLGRKYLYFDPKIDPLKYPTLFMLSVIYNDLGYGDPTKTDTEISEKIMGQAHLVLDEIQTESEFIGWCIAWRCLYAPITLLESSPERAEKALNIGNAYWKFKSLGIIPEAPKEEETRWEVNLDKPHSRVDM